MTYVALAEFVLILALLVVNQLDRNRFLDEAHARGVAWREERRELLNRIQRPERIPIAEPQHIVMPETEPNEWAHVGQILDISDTFGLTDDG